ncbi:MAG: hypothetical protein ACF8GE_05245 [Phycisphaerales bacterium JB043]
MRPLICALVMIVLCGCGGRAQSGSQATTRGPDSGVETQGPPLTDATEYPEQSPAVDARAHTIVVGDHRPSWWIDEAQWSDQRVTLCVEALAPDVLEARRVSVDAARDALRELVGERADQGEIVLTSVKPLPVPANVPGGHSYAGYVMITCALSDE